MTQGEFNALNEMFSLLLLPLALTSEMLKSPTQREAEKRRRNFRIIQGGKRWN
jgi:hypothetical protein